MKFKCEECQGTGKISCLDCDGEGGGEVDDWNPWTETHSTREVLCHTCEGRSSEPCDGCEGTGEVDDE